VCAHTFAEIFKYNGDTIDDSLFDLETTFDKAVKWYVPWLPRFFAGLAVQQKKKVQAAGKRARTN
jgi:hypothetical protein